MGHWFLILHVLLYAVRNCEDNTNILSPQSNKFKFQRANDCGSVFSKTSKLRHFKFEVACLVLVLRSSVDGEGAAAATSSLFCFFRTHTTQHNEHKAFMCSTKFTDLFSLCVCCVSSSSFFPAQLMI